MSVKMEGILVDIKTTVFHHSVKAKNLTFNIIFTFYIINQVPDFYFHILSLIFSYLCSENKGAYQLCSYRKAGLRLCLRICKLGFLMRWLSLKQACPQSKLSCNKAHTLPRQQQGLPSLSPRPPASVSLYAAQAPEFCLWCLV